MIAYNDVSPVAPRLRVFVQKFKEALVSFLEAKRGHSDVILAGVEKLDRADAVLKELEAKEAAIATNARFSALGKQEQMAAKAKEFHERLSFIAQAAKDRRNAAAEIQKKFTSVPKAVDNEAVDYLRGAEIRQRLAKLPMSERTKVVLNGNAQVLRAIMTDPLNEPLVDEEFLQRLQEQHAQKNEGKEWVRMESLIFVAERLEQLATAIDLHLSNYGQVPSFPGQPTRTTDLAFQDTTAAPSKHTAVDQPPAGVSSFQ